MGRSRGEVRRCDITGNEILPNTPLPHTCLHATTQTTHRYPYNIHHRISSTLDAFHINILEKFLSLLQLKLLPAIKFFYKKTYICCIIDKKLTFVSICFFNINRLSSTTSHLLVAYYFKKIIL